MHLKFLAVSDVHLGEDTSLLSYPHGRQRIWEVLRETFGEGDTEEKFEVDEVILVGDVPDRCLSSNVQIIAHTTAFMRMLGSAAKIKKGIYLPGNHDHTIWTNYVKNTRGEDTGITKPDGELLIEGGKVVGDVEPLLEMLTIFFSYPKSSLWRAIDKQAYYDFAIANPLYARHFKGRTYVFTHGTHFRQPDVTKPSRMKAFDWTQFDQLAGFEIDSSGNINDARDLEELEAIAAKLVDTLWPSSYDNPNNRSDQLWYLLNLISGKFSQHRETPENDEIYSWTALQTQTQNRIKRLAGPNNKINDESINLWNEYFIGKMIQYLKEFNMPTKDITFVYGDTHRGGWGELQGEKSNIRLYNTGGWSTTNKENHPACHIFAVSQEGEEFMLDVTYKDVEILGKSLVELASQDAEDRYSLVGKLFAPFFDKSE